MAAAVPQRDGESGHFYLGTTGEQVTVAADQALTITAVTETHDCCHGERMETDPICCVSNHYPEAIVDGQAITVRVRVDLGDVPCMGSIGPENDDVSIPALSAGTYELTALGRDDVGLPDLEISLVIEECSRNGHRGSNHRPHARPPRVAVVNRLQ